MAVKKETGKEEKKTTRKKKKEEVKLEDTTRIRVDDNRINDADSLDVSFMEGKKERVNKERILKEKKDHSFLYSILKGFLIILVVSTLLVFLYMYARDNNLIEKVFKVNPQEIKEEKKEKTTQKMDYNYLFLGDYHTYGMEFNDFYKPFVQVCNEDYTTDDILDNLRDYIYIYNPSDVFIELGNNDIKSDTSVKEVVSNLESIINGIKLNRSMANIYIESLYPINDEIEGFDSDIDKELIKDINEEIEKMAKRLDIKYVDMYKELSEDDLLKEEYTTDGINLNEDGYKRVFKVINRLID